MLLAGIMYTHRQKIDIMLHKMKQHDDSTRTMTTVDQLRSVPKRQQRKSIVNLAVSLEWLVAEFEDFREKRWWFGPFRLVMRLCQSSLLVVFPHQTIQAAYACCIAIVAICAQRNLEPYRRRSDNQVALMAQWTICLWPGVLLMRIVGAVASLPTIIVGLLCVVPTVVVIVRSLQLGIDDACDAFAHDQAEVNRIVNERAKTYKKGDFIVHDSWGDRYGMTASDFSMTFELSPKPARNEILAQENFQLFRQTGRIWALELSSEDVAKHFSTGILITNSGVAAVVEPGCFLITPYPCAGHVSVLDAKAFASTFVHADTSKKIPMSQVRHDDSDVPPQAEVLSRWRAPMLHSAQLFSECTKVHAKVASSDGFVNTIVDGITEACTGFQRGSFLVVDFRGRRYAMKPDQFSLRFDEARPEPPIDPALQKEGYSLYSAAGKVWAWNLTQDDITRYFPLCKFIGKFGGTIEVNVGDWLALPSPAADEVYAIPQDIFENMFAPLEVGDRAVAQVDALEQWGKVLRHHGRVFCRTADVHIKRADNNEMVGEDEEIATMKFADHVRDSNDGEPALRPERQHEAHTITTLKTKSLELALLSKADELAKKIEQNACEKKEIAEKKKYLSRLTMQLYQTEKEEPE